MESNEHIILTILKKLPSISDLKSLEDIVDILDEFKHIDASYESFKNILDPLNKYFIEADDMLPDKEYYLWRGILTDLDVSNHSDNVIITILDRIKNKHYSEFPLILRAFIKAVLDDYSDVEQKLGEVISEIGDPVIEKMSLSDTKVLEKQLITAMTIATHKDINAYYPQMYTKNYYDILKYRRLNSFRISIDRTYQGGKPFNDAVNEKIKLWYYETIIPAYAEIKIIREDLDHIYTDLDFGKNIKG